MAKITGDGKSKQRGGYIDTLSSTLWRQRLAKENAITTPIFAKRLEEMEPQLDKPNTYLKIFQREGYQHKVQEKEYSLDKIQEEEGFDPKCHRFTTHPKHLRQKLGEYTKYPVITSQDYGRRPPIDHWKFSHGE
uniref:Uncharacterized protein n=1 Tax=Chromera velia CCMP2878 TaxID=1169474 RepID=A0A0G4EZX7_9ALVE|eukprot:Cvel_14288.t1-p1 / transcript=Cvel_14288.t1 / gene=Cvel_14288 / organism=Chromera_velia_CCMP2878 / gene_product=hypothetical protein / transcript_product=hypothetical protein / location=Cvel_scaffold1009:16454-18724(+) / protein_length=133 / sequence_SO=supercontig / SO=protein_coding / is_pseudo=false